MEHSSVDYKNTVVRLLRRPTNHENGESTITTFGTPEMTLKAGSSGINSKIGAPIIRHVPSRSNIASNQRQRDVEQTRLTGQTRFYQKTESLSKSNLVSLPREEIPLPDLSSDSQWPSIGGEESGRSQGAWSSVSATPEGKGWSAIVKRAPSDKSLIVRRKEPRTAAEGANECGNEGSSEGEEGEGMGAAGAHQKQRKKKKKKKSSGQEPPQEKKLDKPPQLDIFAYVKQQPVRPVLNRKDTKPSTKEVSTTVRNVLDSTAPSTRRGKEREQPKAKKPTYLRKVIEKEKAAKKELREQGRGIPHDFDVMRQPGTDQSDHSNAPATNGEVIDTNTGQESLTTPTQKSPETTPTATPTNQSPEATPIYDIIPAPSTTPVSQPSPSNPTPSAVTEAGSAIQKRQVHGKRFREYCSHMVTDEINGAAEALLLDLVRFQDRAHLKDPIKARSKRRYVCGLREVYKHLEVGKLKCVIVPPNLDHIQSTGGIDERISAILSLCQSKLVPVVYAMSRRKLAIVLKKKFKIGCVGIFSYDGAEGHYRKLRKLIEEATELYQRVAHPMPPRGSTEGEISPTTNDPLLSGSGSDNSEEEGPIPEPKTGNGTQKTTTDALWDKYLPKKSVPTDPPTNTISQHVNSDVTSTSTNGYTAIEDDIVGSKRVESTYDSQLSTISVEESGTAGATSSLGQHAGVVPADGRVVSPSTTVFQWNINAAEFIPS